MNEYDLIIIGSGPAGLTAALYAGRAGLKTVVFEDGTVGGKIVDAEIVENFPSYPEGISGSDLSNNLLSQVMKYDVDFQMDTVTGIELLSGELKKVNTTQESYRSKTVICAGGAKPKKLGIPGEEIFEGNGVFYCAYCDGNRFADKEVAVIGGGDGGITEGLYMTRIASKVILIEILPHLSGCQVLQRRVQNHPKIVILCSTKVEVISAQGDMRNLRLKNVENGKNWDLQVAGIFILVGLEPRTDYLKDVVKMDPAGHIIVKPNMETNIPGLYATGDIRSGSSYQAITAAGDGATAGIAAAKYIASGPK